MGPTKRGKGTKIMVIADKSSLPVAVHVGSASPAEVTLVEKTIVTHFTKETPTLLIGDKAYDSDPLDSILHATYDINLVAPHKPIELRLEPKWTYLTQVQETMEGGAI